MRKLPINPKLKRTLIVLAVLSLLLASALELYTFGLSSDFLLRWFRSFFAIFLLMSTTVLGIIPAVNYSVNKIVR
ncbi:DUF2798 domain-containing protein [Pontibacter sp. SGAir0037]|uniref:DUF2798 domain-containing protein n=1 Tax=Pontibacter sp. SGAir0037 TaxID=2571030 RepID=UPI0010CD1153|nr:DUF2798 domain-containing protein [Pontibacter sp. SGAir0037]QCR23516.1 DUF2798 domain-containing protein [Pontibacter sp. SGAir0037]